MANSRELMAQFGVQAAELRGRMSKQRERTGSPIRVLHVSASAVGGAARAAYRVHLSAQGAGVNSRFMTERGPLAPGEASLTYRATSGLAPRLLRRARRWKIENDLRPYAHRKPAGYENFRGDRSPYGTAFASALPACDVVHLHWVSGFLDFSALPDIALRAPVVWTLHDMNPFTGGCHYAGDCEGFYTECGRCPQLGSERSDDLSRQVLQRKTLALRALGPDDLHLVTPSRWMAKQAEASAAFAGRPCEVIPYGLDTTVFQPRDRRLARAELGIGDSEKVVLFVSESIGVRRKGMAALLEALGKLKQRDLHLLTVGYGACEFPKHLKVTQLGGIHDDARLSHAYSAADVFACPSLEDNFPNTVLEAMACGVPVVAFDIGGIPEMVSDGETGFLAPAGDAQALAGAIERVLESDNGHKLAAACRERVETQFDLPAQGERYLRLYQRIIR